MINKECTTDFKDTHFRYTQEISVFKRMVSLVRKKIFNI